jgi:hypothetical protein
MVIDNPHDHPIEENEVHMVPQRKAGDKSVAKTVKKVIKKQPKSTRRTKVAASK